ncbi:TetR/AcrR family transcriptional regulator [Microbacterium enclense]|uniref:TetR/AcrR family transcriptional regulator n=1 Tax=Microbacterium enclense TaxID=993073 RepID=A0A443JL56_9MICO|nr:TetR family transcriptional regulator [Microbacterium enclense]RWR21253.1 TetR/AcrR family transcriptional regulator [Microbacterium enclense]
MGSQVSDARPSSRERRPHAVQADARILAAIRERLITDRHSSMAQLADAAGVGMSAIYSRFGSRDQLLRRLSDEGASMWETALDRAHESLDDGDDAWSVLETFVRTASAADVLALGSLDSTPEDGQQRMAELNRRGDELVGRLHARGVLREGVTSGDIGKILEAAGSVRGDGPRRTRTVKTRVLNIAIDGLRADFAPLVGDAPGPRDFAPH